MPGAPVVFRLAETVHDFEVEIETPKGVLRICRDGTGNGLSIEAPYTIDVTHDSAWNIIVEASRR